LLAWALLTSGVFLSKRDNGGRPWLHLPLAPGAPRRRLLVPTASCSAPPMAALLWPARLLGMAHLLVGARDGWVAGWWGSSPNNFFCYLFRANFENPLFWRVLMSPASTVVQGWWEGTRRQR
jgi:hypothetical protein